MNFKAFINYELSNHVKKISIYQVNKSIDFHFVFKRHHII